MDPDQKPVDLVLYCFQKREYNLKMLCLCSLLGQISFKKYIYIYLYIIKDLGPELQCLLKVKEDLSLVLIFQDAKNNISK